MEVMEHRQEYGSVLSSSYNRIQFKNKSMVSLSNTSWIVPFGWPEKEERVVIVVTVMTVVTCGDR